MKGNLIFEILQRKIKNFGGVYASDELPKEVPSFPFAMVVNLDTRKKPGSHWVAIYFDGKRNVSYMDSFGLPPLVKKIDTFIRRNAKKKWYNSKTIQHPLSIKCGEFCIMYLIHRHQKKSNKTFFSQLKTTKYNEKLIERKFKQLKAKLTQT